MSGNGFFTTHLDNGLKIVFEELPGIGSTAVGFLVLTGSRDEPPEQAGISHFLEHLCFKGTPRRSWDQLNREVDRLGALWNAYTWWEGTAYYHWVQSDRVEESIDILSDMMRPKLAEPDFRTEKEVILEEIAMYHDTPSALIVDHLIHTAFGDHPLGTSVLGSVESVSGIRHEQVLKYFHRRYAPNNMVFLATGAVDRSRILEAVRLHTRSWKPVSAGRQQKRPCFRSHVACIHRPEVVREHLALAWQGPEIGSEWEAVARVLARYLGDRENSRFYWTIRQKGLVDAIHAAHYGFTDTGLLYVYASSDPDNAPRVLALVREETERLHSRIDEQALLRARTKCESALVRRAEHGLSRWMQLSERESAGARPESVDEALRDLSRVTPERVQAFLDLFPLDREPALVALGPLETIDSGLPGTGTHREAAPETPEHSEP